MADHRRRGKRRRTATAGRYHGGVPDRREFLTSALSVPAVGWPAPRLRSHALASALATCAADRRAPAAVAADEDFWAAIARAFAVDRSLLNLNNGGVCPAPAVVQDAQRRHLQFSHQAPAHNMWRVLEPQVEAVRRGLAHQLGVTPEELAITRNASESLQICQQGIDLPRGATVLTTDQDYPRMLATFAQRERREELGFVKMPLPHPCTDDDAVVDAFEQQMDAHEPALLLCSHVLYTTGQVLPVARIVAAARQRGVPCIVDGAHAFAHLDFKIADLGCDYYGASLHKWLFAPHGTGLLYVARDRITDLWPLMAADAVLDDDIRKFEQVGTHPVADRLAIAEALMFHRSLGAARKLERLVYLREYWLQRVIDAAPGRFTVHTDRAPGRAGAIATVQLDGVPSRRVAGWLLRRHRILVTAIRTEHFEGIRVSPSVHTTLAELDRFCRALQQAASDGIGD